MTGSRLAIASSLIVVTTHTSSAMLAVSLIVALAGRHRCLPLPVVFQTVLLRLQTSLSKSLALKAAVGLLRQLGTFPTGDREKVPRKLPVKCPPSIEMVIGLF